MSFEEHLFRREAGRMVAVLTRLFGVHNLALAEDVVQDALCRALETWKFNGVPENPGAWLMNAAKNRAIDVLRRERTARTFAPELGRMLESEWTLTPTVQEVFLPDALRDDELRMMLSCCHPRLPEEVQVALVLNILCGFGAGEIANAFLCGRAAIEKRIARGKRVLSGSGTLFQPESAPDLDDRLVAVRRSLYLLFNEGFHGASEEAVRTELCQEAIRLVAVLSRHPATGTPDTHALAALMCFHAARLPARLDPGGDLIPFVDQDRTRWDRGLIEDGKRLLERSAEGSQVSEYHVEAAIAAAHAIAPSVGETRWEQIVALYDALLAMRPSPVVALQRALAIAQLHGPDRALEEIERITDRERLAAYPFYHAAMAEMERRRGHGALAEQHLSRALSVARNELERRFLKAQRVRE